MRTLSCARSLVPATPTIASLILASLTPTALADFVVPDGGNYPWVRGESDLSIYAQWDAFTSVSGPNAPDVGSFVGGDLPPEAPDFDAYDGDWETSGSFLTSTQNIYSFAAPVAPRGVTPSFALGDGYSTTVLVQLHTLGSDIDTERFTLTDDDGNVYEPTDITVAIHDPSIEMQVLISFEIEGNAESYTFDSIGTASSLSFAELAIDLYVQEAGDVCEADFDGDGELSLFDFLAYQNAFDTGDASADFDGDGELTLFDFLAFQNAFAAGCP
ncbi:MAG: GC-type dockerin domain-anchored protein [Phycisphaerales bacterium JB064]